MRTTEDDASRPRIEKTSVPPASTTTALSALFFLLPNSGIASLSLCLLVWVEGERVVLFSLPRRRKKRGAAEREQQQQQQQQHAKREREE